jgi:hypothetical protein
MRELAKKESRDDEEKKPPSGRMGALNYWCSNEFER